MKILHISTLATGGAANAAIRLHKGLLKIGVDSNFLTFKEIPKNKPQKTFSYVSFAKKTLFRKLNYYVKSVYFWYVKDEIHKNKIPKFDYFSTLDCFFEIDKMAVFQNADIINLHWVSEFVNLEIIAKYPNKKFIWTLHDMNSFTGGCHYTSDCLQYNNEKKCISCPQIKGSNKAKYSLETYKKKAEIYQKTTERQSALKIVCPSKWLFLASKGSLLLNNFPTHHIPYGLNTSIFQPFNKNEAREKFNIPKDKKVILFVSDTLHNKRKGFHYMLEALKKLDTENTLLCAIGNTQGLENMQQNIKTLGHISDEKIMALAYSMSDIFVIPSLEDNLPNTLLESISCGTPIVGFNIGGIPDVVKNGVTGLLCEELNGDKLAQTITEALNMNFDSEVIRKIAVDNYAEELQAIKYLKLYKE